MILSYIAGMFTLIALGVVLMIVQLGLIAAFAIIAVVVTAIIAACVGLYMFITHVRRIAGGFG